VIKKLLHKKLITKIILALFMFNTILGSMPLSLNTAYADEVNYPGKDTLPFGSVLKYDFGTADSPVAGGYTKVTTDTGYNASLGYGWNNPSTVNITATDENTGDPLKGDYISGNNVRTVGADSTSYITYDCPTFVVDLPAGFYKLHLIQGSNTVASCSGAYIEGSMRILPWAADDYGTGFDTEPTSLITKPAGTYADNTVTVAVWDGQLTVQVSTSMTPAGVSGTAYINSLEIERVEHNLTPNDTPRIRSIGDSTVATYPPFDNPQNYAPIPEQTGWGGKLAMFFNGVVGDNWGVGGISARNYITQNFLNRFLLGLKPGDVVTVEWGINESAAGRRYIAATAAEFDPYVQKYIDAIKAYGAIPVLVSATSGGAGYTDRLKALATSNNISYVDLKTLWSNYKSTRSSTQQGYLTVDGTHLSRVGGVVAGQIIANAMKSLTNTSLSAINVLNVSTAPTAVNTVPTVIPQNLRVAAQTKDSVTLAWDVPETDLYNPTQLITRFPVYRKAVGAADSTYAEVAEGTAYVTPDLNAPKLKLTIASSSDYVYAIASRGVNGTGAKSAGITVTAYTETSTDKINNAIKIFDKLYPSDFTIASYAALSSAIDAGKSSLASGTGLDEAAASITAALTGLQRKMSTNLYDDFQTVTTASWGTTQDPSGVDMTYNMSDDGNRFLNYYVSAAGERSRRKTFTAVTANKVSAEFEWLPGKPDTRNVTELRFYGIVGTSAAPANDLYFTLKTANDGHVGYCTGGTTTPVNTSSIATPGVDLGLDNKVWYNVKIDFNFVQHTATLTMKPRDDASAAATVVSNVSIPSNITKLSYMRWHAARGKTDAGGNDLSVLWSTSVDNFGYYYLPAATAEGDAAALATELATAKSVDASLFTAASYAPLASAIALGDRILTDFVISQTDVDYVMAALTAATSGLVTIPPVDTYKFDFGTGAVAPGYTAVTSSAIKTGSSKYGFSGSGMTDFNRNTADALKTDGINVVANTEFDVVLPNKDYTVTVTYGDPSSASNAGTTTNVTTATDVGTPANFNVIKKAAASVNTNSTRTDSFSVSVLDGILRVIFTGTNININAMTITPIANRTPGTTPTLYITGDSTVTNTGASVTNTDSSGNVTTGRYVGWGKNINSNITGAAISNQAVAGRGIRGFYSENRMDPIFTVIRPGDYFIVEFGHNDANTANAGRYSTIPEFKEYLKYTCDAVKAHGATPILITVLTHVRDFDESNPGNSTGYTMAPYTSTSQIKRSFPGYAQATRDIAAELGVACYDLNEETYQLYLEKGIDWVKSNIITVDGVHPIDSSGSVYLARMVADGLAASNISGLSDKFLANKAKLQEAANTAALYDLTKYTAESSAPVSSALASVNALIAGTDARQTAAVSAITQLNAAVAGLERITAVEKPAVSLTGSAIVEPDKDFEVGVSLTGDIKGIYAEDITLDYDKDLFDFIKVDPESDKVMLANVITSGALRIVAANQGGITGSALILNLAFHAKGITTQTPSAITITGAKLGSPLPLPNGTVTNAEKGKLDVSVVRATIPVTGVSIDQGDAKNMAVGDTAALTAKIIPLEATDKTLTWSSDATTVAAINAATGEVTANAEGKAVITVTAAGGATDTITITVTRKIIPAASITLSAINLRLKAGGTVTLTAGVTPVGSTSELVWSSDNTTVAAVDAAGKVTANAAGTAMITVASTDNPEVKATCTVTVYIEGDLNDDGTVDVGDLAIAAYYYMAKEGDPNWNEAKIADVDGDNDVDIIDLASIAKNII
jgi:lysophospholipase L1-like esterase/uncharacterized protein YjdB